MHDAAGDLAKVAWACRRFDDVPVVQRAGQRRKPAEGYRHAVGNDASVVLAECIAGTEQAFTDQMNALGKKIGLTNSHFGTANGWPDNGVTYVTARDLATLARYEIEHHYKLYRQFIRGRALRGEKRLGPARTSLNPTATRSSARCRAPMG